MTDLEFADKIDAIGKNLPNLVGDHLKLITYGKALEAEAEAIRNPPAPEVEGEPIADETDNTSVDLTATHGDA